MTANIVLDKANQSGNEDLVALIPQMKSFAKGLCRNATEADDLTQAALENAWRGQNGYTPGTNMRAWVLRIVRNQYFSDKRRSWRVNQLDPEIAETILVDYINPVAALELDDVRRAMDQLNEDQRRALNLVAVVGLAYEEAAVICNCAVGTIKSRVSRARQILTVILAEGRLSGQTMSSGLATAEILADAERAQLPRPARARSRARSITLSN